MTQPPLNVLVVGAGGREHAIAWKLRQSPRLGHLYLAPGNAGTASLGQNVPIAAEDVSALTTFARDNGVDLAVVGPEVPLAAGLVDALAEVGVRAFGPSQAAAQLESSKAFAKAFMLDRHIPTAAYASFDDYEEARDYLETCSHQVVVKADGLAAGKGVIVCDTKDEAADALKSILLDGDFGAAGHTVVIEERITGPEISLMAFCDGQTVVPMIPARDHKRIFDDDQGPNTGGMGAFAPVPDLAPDFVADMTRAVLQPVIDGMAARGIPYKGILYAGLMLTPDGAKTLEFNCRFGDPETQVVLPLLDADLIEIMLACIESRLHEVEVKWFDAACAGVVAASPGYPGSYRRGLPITGLDDDSRYVVFHAGTAHNDADQIVTSGGRVLVVSAVGDTLDEALTAAYAGIEAVHFDGMHYRRDIGRVSSNTWQS